MLQAYSGGSDAGRITSFVIARSLGFARDDKYKLEAMLLALAFVTCASAQTVTVGSKKFTESYVLGEMARKVIADTGLKVEHKQGIGATGIVWEALRHGDITMYPEYTGTLSTEILKLQGKATMADLRRECAKLGIGVSDPLGFNNTYALVMSDKKAAALGIETMSDLAKHPDLNAGPDPEFLGRKDGWEPMREKYGLRFADTRAIDHGLVYQSVARGDIDVTDCYSTDAQIATFNLRVLKDDKEFFPAYKAVFVYQLDAPAKALEAIRKLEGRIDEKTMTGLNADAERAKDYTAAANKFFIEHPEPAAADKGKLLESETVASKILRLSGQHLFLVIVSLLIAIVVGIPLGILAARPGVGGAVILGIAGVIQTIPSLALLAFLVPLMGISVNTAILALFLYSLLPIIRNTATGLQSVPTPIRESAEALGLEPAARLRKVYMPMASRTILAGIKTAAVINVGTATLAALIGAGGLGELIISGISLVDTPTILQGAIPAAILALLVQGLFELLDRWAVPKGLTIGNA